MRKLHIARHDGATRKIINEISRGRKGSFYCIADVGTLDALQEIGVHSKRIPSFMLPAQYLHSPREDTYQTSPLGSASHQLLQRLFREMQNGDIPHYDVRNIDLGKLRPDLMIVEMRNATELDKALKNQTPYSGGKRSRNTKKAREWAQGRKVYIMETGYCNDHNHDEKVTEKLKQHRFLATLLGIFGYDVTVIPLPLGSTGTVYKSTKQALLDLGISSQRADKCLNSLHIHAVRYAHSLGVNRRKLEQAHKSHTHQAHKTPPTAGVG